MPVPIAAEPLWREPAAQRRAIEAAWAEFAAAGLADRGGLDSDAAVMLDVLTHPHAEYVAVVLTAAGIAGSVVASRGHDVIVAVRQSDDVTLAGMRGVSLPDTLIRQIPDATPAPIEPVNIRASDVPAADELAGFDTGLPDGLQAISDQASASGLHSGGWGDGRSAAQRDADTIARLRGLPVLGQGEMHITLRDAYGRQRRSDPIRYQDYPIGRVVVANGQGFLSIAPASKTQLRDRLVAAHRRLDDAQRIPE